MRRRIAASSAGVTRDGVRRNRAFDVVVTRCATAQQGLVQPFSALGAIRLRPIGPPRWGVMGRGCPEKLPIAAACGPLTKTRAEGHESVVSNERV
jgi:hypothetical protein